MFKNKHVIIARLVSPLLAILAWFAVGQLAGEKPAVAQPGKSYPLVEKSNCRYDSGACDIENEDLRLRLSLGETAGALDLQLSASHPLDGVLLAVSMGDADSQPAAMSSADAGGMEWRLPLSQLPPEGARLHVAARAGQSNFFADTATAFLDKYREGRP
ncbi:MAG: hypothetical protein AAGI11_18190 [Pseudomonadota bacterium]